MPAANAMTNVVPALTARTQFGQILRRVKQNRERFVVDRRGEPQAVIMSVDDYLERFAKPPSAALAAIQRAARQRGLNRLPPGEINLVVQRVRRARRHRGAH